MKLRNPWAARSTFFTIRLTASVRPFDAPLTWWARILARQRRAVRARRWSSGTVEDKTVTRLLTDDQVADYQAWFDNARRLRGLVSELEALSLQIVEDDPRSRRRPGGRPPRADP